MRHPTLLFALVLAACTATHSQPRGDAAIADAAALDASARDAAASGMDAAAPDASQHPDAAATAPACKVGGQTYASGSGGIPDPVSCNTCSCDAGKLNSCTKIACPKPCPAHTSYATSCALCGPTDACEVMEFGCFSTCKSSADCTTAGYGFCLQGICKNVCG